MPTPFEEAAIRVQQGADPGGEADALLAAMSLEEKLACLDGDMPFWDGVIDSIEGGYWKHPWPAAAVPRLGIPGIQFSDGPRGVVIGAATAFPVSMARGATFDPALEERIGDAIGRELAAVGATLYGGVCVNLLRHPAWGRAQETYGEDPHHVGELGAALTRGVQRHVMACVKHFACNSIENARFKVDVTADERTLHEVYLPHFRRVVGAGVAAVMSAYNSVNGEWCGQNPTLLSRILREEWGFEGFVISDFQFGLRDAVRSVAAGLDIEMPYRQLRAQELPAAVAEGRLDIAAVDASVRRTLASLLRFARAFTAPAEPAVLACAAHRALAREVAQKSIVLLRNEGEVLPLDAASLRRLAVIGPLAAVANIGDGGSSNVHPPYVVTPLEGLRLALPEVEVLHDDGSDLASARAVAAAADVVVVVCGYTHRDEGEYIDLTGMAELFSLFPPMTDPAQQERLQAALVTAAAGGGFAPGGDRVRLTLPESQEALIETVAAAHPKVVVALMGGSAVIVERWHSRVAALLLLWYPGMEGGHALADVVLGRVAPSGRLPFAVPRRAADLPPFDRDATQATYDLWHGQWKLDHDGVDPAYPFGFGLGTTTFAIEAAVAEGDGAERTIRATVRNTGPRAGATVVQVYAALPGSRYERPARRLVGFHRVELDAGASAGVAVPISLATLAVRENGAWVLEPGRYRLTVAQHAGDPCGIAVETDFG